MEFTVLLLLIPPGAAKHQVHSSVSKKMCFPFLHQEYRDWESFAVNPHVPTDVIFANVAKTNVSSYTLNTMSSQEKKKTKHDVVLNWDNTTRIVEQGRFFPVCVQFRQSIWIQVNPDLGGDHQVESEYFRTSYNHKKPKLHIFRNCKIHSSIENTQFQIYFNDKWNYYYYYGSAPQW